VRHNLRAVLETINLAELSQGRLPWRIDAMLNNPETWHKR